MSEEVRQEIKLLLVSTLAEVKSRGSLATDINIDTESMKSVSKPVSVIPVITTRDNEGSFSRDNARSDF